MELAWLDGRALIGAALAFLCGALPFSVWVTHMQGADVRAVGDRNPGATNAFKAGGLKSGLAALLLDVSKAAIPVGLAYQVFGLRGSGMLLIAIAPMLGHAYSPFLNFKGGKAVASALGVWIGLTLWDVPLVALAGILLGYTLLRNSGWAVVLSLVGIGSYLLWLRPETLLLEVLGLQSALLLWKYREELRQAPRIRQPS